MSAVDPKLTKWLQETGADVTPEGPIVLIKLFHAIDGDPEGVLLQSINVAEGSLESVEFAQAVWELAEREAATVMGTNQRFVILAYRPDQEEYDRRFPFLIRGRSAGVGPMGGDTVPPNEVGLTAQMLRHDAENHRLIVLHSSGMAERQENELQRKSQYIEQLENRHLKTLMLQEDLLDRKSERELRHGIEQHKAKRLDQAMGMVMNFFPLFLAHIAGGKNIPGSQIATTARDMAVGSFLKNLSQEEGMKLFHSLSPENQVLFMEFYKSYRAENEVSEAAKPEVLRDQESTH
jgi:hypothetical protein